MRIALAALAAAFALLLVMPDDATAQSRGTRAKAKKAKVVGQVRPAQRRAASVGQNGLCQRDTGTSTSELNFRNRCDMEEFWNRIMERNSAGDL